MNISNEAFYASRKYEGRVALPIGIHEDTVVYHISEKIDGRDVVTFRNLTCTKSVFAKRYA